MFTQLYPLFVIIHKRIALAKAVVHMLSLTTDSNDSLTVFAKNLPHFPTVLKHCTDDCHTMKVFASVQAYFRNSSMCTTAGAIFSTTSAMKLNLYLGLLGCVGPILAERITHVNKKSSTMFSFVMQLLSFYSPK